MRLIISEEDMKKIEQKSHESFWEAAINPPRPDVDTIFKLIVVTIDRDYDDEGKPIAAVPFVQGGRNRMLLQPHPCKGRKDYERTGYERAKEERAQ